MSLTFRLFLDPASPAASARPVGVIIGADFEVLTGLRQTAVHSFSNKVTS